MNNLPEDFVVYHHTVPKKESHYSFTSVKVLSNLIGLEWNELTLCYVLSLNPSAIRVSSGSLTADAYTNRITIMVNNNNEMTITDITMEVQIPTPDGYTGYDLNCNLNRIINQKGE